jgi:hypoxanthine phosphoribosyltransferase
MPALSNDKIRKTAFVIMPSGNHEEYRGGVEESDFIYAHIICPALTYTLGEDVTILREVDNRKSGAITRELIRHIAEADVSIVDVTGLNPNVFLELGVRYALRRSITVLLKQSGATLPFDISDYRCIDYSPFYGGPAKAMDDIIATLESALSQGSSISDSLVFNVLPDLRVELPGIIENEHDDEMYPGIMPWREYWARFEIVIQSLSDRVRDGSFVPHVIVGISNGGLIFADLLGRHLIHDKPVLSLWADRVNKDGNYFDNSMNHQIAKAIDLCASQASDRLNVLLVDDIVASGTTHKQAVRYLNTRLPKAHIYFLPLFSRNEKYLDVVREHLIWFSAEFKGKFKDEDVIKIHGAERKMLPYKKEIRSA